MDVLTTGDTSHTTSPPLFATKYTQHMRKQTTTTCQTTANNYNDNYYQNDEEEYIPTTESPCLLEGILFNGDDDCNEQQQENTLKNNDACCFPKREQHRAHDPLERQPMIPRVARCYNLVALVQRQEEEEETCQTNQGDDDDRPVLRLPFPLLQQTPLMSEVDIFGSVVDVTATARSVSIIW